MAANNFTKIVPQILKIEGGISDRPLKDDPGGLTAMGVTQKVYDNWRTLRKLPLKSVREITTQEVVAIAKANYWTPVQGDKLPSGVDFAVFDFAFNSGPAQAVKEMQRVLGVGADGVVGLATLKALAGADAAEVINGICDRRLAFMKRLKNWNANKNGWTRRVAHVRAQSLALASGDAVEHDVELTGLSLAKAVPDAPTPPKKSATVWSLVVGGVATVVTTAKDILLQIPDFANTAMSGLGVFVDKSPLAQTIANGIGALGAIGVLYATYSVIKSKREAHNDNK